MKTNDDQLALIEAKPEEPSVLKPGQKLKRWRNKKPRCVARKD
ncbi:hypothetical protein [Leptolyngbya sp. UWPOB_LEPTO1]|nr:hypothetical protein [Leptolyngbya sp. UWPOB_LEPTO1]